MKQRRNTKNPALVQKDLNMSTESRKGHKKTNIKTMAMSNYRNNPKKKYVLIYQHLLSIRNPP